jgi:hypothetical protein
MGLIIPETMENKLFMLKISLGNKNKAAFPNQEGCFKNDQH